MEVQLELSENHNGPILISWEFLEWQNARQMKLQLIFNVTEAISMEVPQDKVNVTFWSVKEFTALDGVYVEP